MHGNYIDQSKKSYEQERRVLAQELAPLAQVLLEALRGEAHRQTD